MIVPGVNRIAPQLAVGAEVVGRHAGQRQGVVVCIQVHQRRIGPHVAAVEGQVNGNVAEQQHTAAGGIAVQLLPLLVEQELQNLDVFQGHG